MRVGVKEGYGSARHTLHHLSVKITTDAENEGEDGEIGANSAEVHEEHS